jgi:hypothetical protein
MSAWRGEVNLLDLAKPEYQPFTQKSRRTPAANAAAVSGERQQERSAVVGQAMDALARIGARRAG